MQKETMQVKAYGGLLFILCVWMQTGNLVRAQACSTPLGVENGLILDNQLTASSAYGAYGASKARLASGSYWYPERTDAKARLTSGSYWYPESTDRQWLQVDLKSRKTITGIITQGAKNAPYSYYVTLFKVSYSDNGRSWTVIKDANGSEKIFTGNTGCCDHAKNPFDSPITSRFVRVLPTAWQRHIALRIELLGCED